MDLRAIRTDLADVAQLAGFNAWDYTPDDLQDLPAAVVGPPSELTRLNQHKTQALIPVSLFVSLASAEDATERLDRALSIGVEGSFLDLIDAADGAWNTVTFKSASTYELVGSDDTSHALATQIFLEVIA